MVFALVGREIARILPRRPKAEPGASTATIRGPRASGGIGRRAGFRFLCPQGRGGSTPPSPTARERRRGRRRSPPAPPPRLRCEVVQRERISSFRASSPVTFSKPNPTYSVRKSASGGSIDVAAPSTNPTSSVGGSVQSSGLGPLPMADGSPTDPAGHPTLEVGVPGGPRPVDVVDPHTQALGLPVLRVGDRDVDVLAVPCGQVHRSIRPSPRNTRTRPSSRPPRSRCRRSRHPGAVTGAGA